MSDMRNNLPTQWKHLADLDRNWFGNPLPRCRPGLTPTKWTIAAMAYRGTAAARQLAQMVVVRNLDLRMDDKGFPKDESARQILSWQNFLQPGGENYDIMDEYHDIQSNILVACMAQCVGTLSHSNCTGGNGAHTSCTRCARGFGPFDTCVYVGPVAPGSPLFLKGSCPSCFYHGHGEGCSCRPGVLDGTWKQMSQPSANGNNAGGSGPNNGSGSGSVSGTNGQRMITMS
ncbi:hypothetical protein BKA65DRAFT_485691 [Rhexocercosporidium sp. MPI-PUGE-AT-0058]|nr:hypothetical protein BKA65DRAFT_485691 [Rhexocercosporidium sp. MPI-PUGE-AT-0058]